MEVSDAVCHELIHHYDHVTGRLQPQHQGSLEACTALARSEIRAAALSGDCKFTRELLRGNLFPISRHLQLCAKRRASLSIMNALECTEVVDKQSIIEAVFEEAFNDTMPFPEIP